MPLDTRGQIVVKQDEPPARQEPPSSRLLALVIVLVVAAAFGVGAIGEQPATDDVDGDRAAVSAPSTTGTAATTTTTAASVAAPSDGDVPLGPDGAVLLTGADLATDLLTVETIQLPSGLGPIAHLVESRGVAHAFSHVEERDGLQLGLKVASWHEGWGTVVEAIPATEDIVGVGGHDLGLVVLTQPAVSANVPFGEPISETLSVWTSTDGVGWTRRPLDPPVGLADLVPVTLAVGPDRVWVFGYRAPADPLVVLEALPIDVAEVVRSGDLVVDVGPDGVIVRHSALPTPFTSFSFNELGLDRIDRDNGRWARIETDDFETWTQSPTPPVYAASVGRDGTLLGMDPDGTVWRLDGESPEVVLAPEVRGIPTLATKSDLGVYAVMGEPMGTVRRIGPDGDRSDFRFAGCCFAFGHHPVSSALGALFNASLWGGRRTPEVALTVAAGDAEVVVNLDLGVFEARGAAGEIIARASVFGDGGGLLFDAATSTVSILTTGGTVAATIPVGELGSLYDLADFTVDRPGVLYTDGEHWQRIDLPDGPTAMLPIDDGFLVSTDDADTALVYLRAWDGADR